jgi:hypothetical protein
MNLDAIYLASLELSHIALDYSASIKENTFSSLLVVFLVNAGILVIAWVCSFMPIITIVNDAGFYFFILFMHM